MRCFGEGRWAFGGRVAVRRTPYGNLLGLNWTRLPPMIAYGTQARWTIAPSCPVSLNSVRDEDLRVTLMVVCDEGHSFLAAPWERGEPNGVVGWCCVCGAVARLQEHGGHTPLPGTPPPDYDIVGPLHGGVMAEVYRARHRPSGRLVALKLGTSRSDGGGRGRIRREAAMLGGLHHPKGSEQSCTTPSPVACPSRTPVCRIGSVSPTP
jgi:hypothetical protein